MADEEKDAPEQEAESDEVAELEERIEQLEQRLARAGPELSPAARWTGWILGALAAATSLSLIVIILGGGWPRECDCPGGGSAGTVDRQGQEAAIDTLLRRNSSDFQDCFEAWASEHSNEIRPGWAVIVRIEVEADETGRVQRVEASGENLPEPLGECLQQRIGRWIFPGPGPFTMELPFTIEGGGDHGQMPSFDSAEADGGPAVVDGAAAADAASADAG